VREDWIDGMPPEDAYGRVTDPGRYRVLHTIADAVVEDLIARYDVRVLHPRNVVADFPEPPAPDSVVRVVHLVPPDPAAAPFTVVFTDFPGIVARCGRWSVERYPVCGCDACDEDAVEAAERMRSLLTAVAASGFHESMTRTRRWLSRAYDVPGIGSRSSRFAVDRPSEVAHFGAPGEHAWRQWPVRTPSAERP
jgi:Family of unknown function (DUF6226)